MKILYTINDFPVADGSSIYFQELSESLNKLGHKSIIMTSDQKKKNI